MIARAGSGWQTVLADLSLILFITAVATMSVQPSPGGAAQPEAASAPPAQGEPLAIYHDTVGAPPFAQWLAQQQGDARQQLTVTARYRPGEIDAALAQAAALIRRAGSAGLGARVVLEPGEGGVSASLAFDAGPQSLARELRNPGQTHSSERSLP